MRETWTSPRAYPRVKLSNIIMKSWAANIYLFKLLFSFIPNLYNLIANNGCFQQPACKIPRNVAVCFCRPMWPDSNTPRSYPVPSSLMEPSCVLWFSYLNSGSAFIYLHNFSLYSLTFLMMPVWLSCCFFVRVCLFVLFCLGLPCKVLLQKANHPPIQKLLYFLVRQLSDVAWP